MTDEKICPLFSAAWVKDKAGNPLPMLCIGKNCQWMMFDGEDKELYCAVRLIAEALNTKEREGL